MGTFVTSLKGSALSTIQSHTVIMLRYILCLAVLGAVLAGEGKCQYQQEEDMEDDTEDYDLDDYEDYEDEDGEDLDDDEDLEFDDYDDDEMDDLLIEDEGFIHGEL